MTQQGKPRVLYFAYGSNMSTDRLRARIHETIVVGTGVLENYTFACDKASQDGSGKGNIHKLEGSRVWGVLFDISANSLYDLDRIESGYERIKVRILTRDGEVDAVTYLSENLTDEPPYDTYMKYIIDGAKEHQLPEEYFQMLVRISTKPEKKA